MTSPVSNNKADYDEEFHEFMTAFAEVGKNSGLFPKKCSICGKEFSSFPEYINRTKPLAHGLEPYTDSMDALHTMQYRNCHCGTTLCINFTSREYPLLEKFWEMIGKKSKREGIPVRAMVLRFREQCNAYMERHQKASPTDSK